MQTLVKLGAHPKECADFFKNKELKQIQNYNENLPSLTHLAVLTISKNNTELPDSLYNHAALYEIGKHIHWKLHKVI